MKRIVKLFRELVKGISRGVLYEAGGILEGVIGIGVEFFEEWVVGFFMIVNIDC